MINTAKQKSKIWKHKDDCEQYLWYKLHEEDGPWYDKYIYNYAKDIIEKNPKTI